MHEKDIQLVEDTFKKFYFDHFNLIHVPKRTSEREFGYQKFNHGMNRHLSFKNVKELHLMLITNIPSDVYCSNAYYTFPNLPMAEKDWKEADLIFDIDAKDLNLVCRHEHTVTKCLECNSIFSLANQCHQCHSIKLEKKSLPCKNCLSESKREVKKLNRILIDDLGINQDSIKIFFSGNEGFHIHIEESSFQKSSSRERAELVDYIMFRGTIPEAFGMKRFQPNRSQFPELDDKGWPGRVSQAIFESKTKRSKKISELISKGYQSFQLELESLSGVIGARIDPNVTMDIHRIFRLPGSINSKSGLCKIECNSLDKFDPYVEACLLDDTLTEITANCPIKFRLRNKNFGPYLNEKVSVPKYAAVYMICKGFATVSS